MEAMTGLCWPDCDVLCALEGICRDWPIVEHESRIHEQDSSEGNHGTG